ncbi:MAG: hypothetical protein PPP58_03840 [Natronomonas sp.]
MGTAPDDTFLLGSTAAAVAGMLLATVTPLAAGESSAFAGSIVTSGVLGLVFAVRNVQLYRKNGVPSIPAATLTTIFGVWFMLAPLLYDVGFLATAGTQLGGLVISAFGMYALVAALTDER